ncbi:hypothetical protein GPECTOR_2g1401 [Gonium pectorale]|uniref:Beta-Casp domain-containing protein n=1 Tax=Gonium pectorale TaxID=33097 RepID=A0A150H2N7_GONPE|nr:hypothetical protein GPECTOR_2g1401 [Gonium pectorale]|eukprot:KXZ55850.1 hypothetical protein GPECTOR_2g1401 [Gonium pectorale]
MDLVALMSTTAKVTSVYGNRMDSPDFAAVATSVSPGLQLLTSQPLLLTGSCVLSCFMRCLLPALRDIALDAQEATAVLRNAMAALSSSLVSHLVSLVELLVQPYAHMPRLLRAMCLLATQQPAPGASASGAASGGALADQETLNCADDVVNALLALASHDVHSADVRSWLAGSGSVGGAALGREGHGDDAAAPGHDPAAGMNAGGAAGQAGGNLADLTPFLPVVSLDSYELTAAAYPSGSGFGHAVWQITDGAERCRTLLYLPDAAPAHPFAPPLPLELLRGPDALILAPDMLAPPQRPPTQQQRTSGEPGAPRAPHHAPTHAATRPPMPAIKELVLRAVVSGGSALLLVHANGEAWELLEGLAGALASADLGSVPLALLGPMGRPSLALAACSLEALAPERQAAVYRPQHPFAFDSLIKAGRLLVAPSLGEGDPALQRCLDQPSVFLAAADSLHYEGATAATNVAAPPLLRMQLAHLPLRGCGPCAGPPPSAALELLTRLQPRHLLLSQRDLEALRGRQRELAADQSALGGGEISPPPLARESVVPYSWLSQSRVALPRNVAGALVDPELLQRLHWLPGGPGLQLARLNTLLTFRDGAWHADTLLGGSSSANAVAAGLAVAGGGAVAADQLLLAVEGRPALGGLLESLAGAGLTRVAVEADGEVTRIRLDGTDAELLLRPGGAHIDTSCPALRHVLTTCLMAQLTVL